MLAQLNCKQKSIFFNLKPTVIDKLISKNKSSIQNSLLSINEDSDASLSEDTIDSSSSNSEIGLVTPLHHPATMAPIRRSEKATVLGSKLSSRSEFPMKRGPGRPANTQVKKKNNNMNIITAKKLLENSKRGSPRNILKDVQSVKLRRNHDDSPTHVNNKRLQTSPKNGSLPLVESKSIKTNISFKSLDIKRKPKLLKDTKTVVEIVKKNPLKNPLNTKGSTLVSLNTKSSPRKFPSNIMDHWTSTGMVIRGRGRPRGSSRGSLRGGRRGQLRLERYNTRDSLTGLMRSGKRRKCSDPNLVEGLEGIRKRRRVINKIKKEKNDCPSDEHSSFITTSEHSFYHNENSLKQSDEEINNPKLFKVKVEIGETEDETIIHPRDTNSNVFHCDKEIKQEVKASTSCLINDTKITPTNLRKKRIYLEKNKFGKLCKSRNFLEKNVLYTSDLSVKDSDCSLDSDVIEEIQNFPRSGLKRQRRKGVDGLWVRRSTRSVMKNTRKGEQDAVVLEEIMKEKDLIVDLSDEGGIYSSLHELDQTISGEKSPKENKPNRIVAEKSLIDTMNTYNKLPDYSKSEEKVFSSFDGATNPFEINSDLKNSVSSDLSNDMENDSLVDFTLSFEDTPVKEGASSTSEIKSEIPSKLHFESLSSDKDIFTSNKRLHESPPSSVDLTVDTLELNCSYKEATFPQKKESLSKDFETENSPADLEGQSSDIFKLDNIQSANDNEQSNYVVDNVDEGKYLNKDKSIDVLSKVIENSVERVCNDRELISDEKILSLIDSFCQSDSMDVISDEKPSEFINEEDEKKSILDSLNEITSEVERKILVETHLEELSSTRNSFVDGDKKLEGNIIIVQSCAETNCNTSMVRECPQNKELLNVINDEIELRTIIYDDMKLQKNVFENTQTEVSCTKNMAIEIDIDSTDKTTEESSSSDSNSNVSELISTSLENNPQNIKMESNLATEHLKERDSEIVQAKENPLYIDKVLSEPDKSYPETQCEIFSMFLDADLSSKTERMSKDVICTQNNLLRKSSIEENLEERPSKELLSALGLQSLHGNSEEKPKRHTDSYTGTLKAVIKLNRSSDKRSGGGKMIFKQSDKLIEDSGAVGDRLEYRICSSEELATEGVPLTHLADIPNNNRKTQLKVKSQFDLSNNSNIVGAAGTLDTPVDSTKDTGGKQNLIIPEKSSSFSIHPERLCTDVCSYCFGKFGSLDTPCHLAQLKNSERQAKILSIEVHLSADSCLCDGCFRYVDRKANCPTSQQRSRKPAARRGPLAGTICAVQDCTQTARHSVRRKWLIKLKKSIGKKLVIDMDKNPHLPFPLCSQHYYWVDYFTVCGICKKRLTRNHMYALGPEADDLNKALSDDGIPVRLSDKLFLCKLCRYYSSLRLKYRDTATMSPTHRLFLNSYRKKILHYHDIPVSDSEEEGKSVEEEGITSETLKPKKKKSKSKSLESHESKKRNSDKEEKSDPGNDKSNDSQMIDYSYLDTLNVHREEPTVDYSTLGDFEGQVGFNNIASLLNPLEAAQGTVYSSDTQNRSRVEKPTRIQVKFGNLNIGKLSNLNIGQDSRPASSTTPALERPSYLPGERELKLSGEFEFHGTLNPSSGWERCTSTIQFDRDTKRLWQDLQRPYGNQSSFLRHLVILEKHWRNGSLVLSENPNPRAVKYISSVRNRVQAYDGANFSDVTTEKPNKSEVNMTLLPPQPISFPLKVTSAPPPLMKIAPGSTPWLHDPLRRPPPYKCPPTSTQTTATNSKFIHTAPPPYRFPASRANQFGSRTIRMPASSPIYTNTSKGQQNVRPLSISYQQFKKIRLEQPQISSSQVTIVPKVDPSIEIQSISTTSSSAEDFAPLISDVRSLATSTSDWNESFRKQQQKMLKQTTKYYTPILPKIPNSLTVTTFPQTAALVMKTSSLTIEKAPNISSKPNIAPPEKPSISVFRETTHSENS